MTPDWKWLGVRNLPYRGQRLTWFVVRLPELKIYSNFQFHQSTPYIAYDDDISDCLQISGHAAVGLALRQGENLVIFVGNTTEGMVTTAVRIHAGLSGSYRKRAFMSLRNDWIDGDLISAQELQRGIGVQLERKGFEVIELQQEV